METVFDPTRNRVVLVGVASTSTSTTCTTGTDVGLYGPLSPTSVMQIGTGCAGSRGVPTFFSIGQPFIGNPSFHVTVLATRPNAPAALGISPVGPPLTVGSCTLYLRPPAVFLSAMTNPAGVVNFRFAIPFDQALLGAVFHSQAFVTDPGSALGIAATRAAVLSVGD